MDMGTCELVKVLEFFFERQCGHECSWERWGGGSGTAEGEGEGESTKQARRPVRNPTGDLIS